MLNPIFKPVSSPDFQIGADTAGNMIDSNWPGAGLKFETFSPVRAKTWFEQYIETGILRTDQMSGQNVFMPKTMSEATAHSMTKSPQFLIHIARVSRILDVPIPIRLLNGDIMTPKPDLIDRWASIATRKYRSLKKSRSIRPVNGF